jgi:hypothetical protein
VVSQATAEQEGTAVPAALAAAVVMEPVPAEPMVV